MNLGKAIKILRTERDMTLTDLSIRSNISYSYLSLIENNKRNISIDTATKIANVFQLTLAQLLERAQQYT